MTPAREQFYRWLARSSTATSKLSHAFTQGRGFSLCGVAAREGEWDLWQPDARWQRCAKCEDKLASKTQLTEVRA